VLGIILFDDVVSPLRVTCIGLIVIGILGLKFAD
jgi:multidrug transporter EmrE-like cation transporter